MSLGFTWRPPRSFRQPLSPGRQGRAVPAVRPQVTMTAALRSGAARGGQPCPCPVPQRARRTFAFKVRTGLGQTRETLSCPQTAPRRTGPNAFGLGQRSVPGLCPGCAGRVVAAGGLLGLTTDGTAWLSPPRPAGGARAFGAAVCGALVPHWRALHAGSAAGERKKLLRCFALVFPR